MNFQCGFPDTPRFFETCVRCCDIVYNVWNTLIVTRQICYTLCNGEKPERLLNRFLAAVHKGEDQSGMRYVVPTRKEARQAVDPQAVLEAFLAFGAEVTTNVHAEAIVKVLAEHPFTK